MLPNREHLTLQFMPDDHSELVPPLPIPNRTVKRLCADDSAATSVKVGHRQAVIRKPSPRKRGGFLLCANEKKPARTEGFASVSEWIVHQSRTELVH